jgi:hypothetical protein
MEMGQIYFGYSGDGLLKMSRTKFQMQQKTNYVKCVVFAVNMVMVKLHVGKPESGRFAFNFLILKMLRMLIIIKNKSFAVGQKF